MRQSTREPSRTRRSETQPLWVEVRSLRPTCRNPSTSAAWPESHGGRVVCVDRRPLFSSLRSLSSSDVARLSLPIGRRRRSKTGLRSPSSTTGSASPKAKRKGPGRSHFVVALKLRSSSVVQCTPTFDGRVLAPSLPTEPYCGRRIPIRRGDCYQRVNTGIAFCSGGDRRLPLPEPFTLKEEEASAAASRASGPAANRRAGCRTSCPASCTSRSACCTTRRSSTSGASGAHAISGASRTRRRSGTTP